MKEWQLQDPWDFDPDEFFFMAAAGVVTLVLGLKYFRGLLLVDPMVSPAFPRIFLVPLAPACALFVFGILTQYSDPATVRGHADYLTLFIVGAGAWIFSPVFMGQLLGCGLRDDVVERNNPAATVWFAGMTAGITLCYAGANIGSGPTIWTTIVPALLGALVFFLSLLLIVAFTVADEVIAIDRHVPTAVILSAFAIVAGADLAWAEAGDWHSWDQTFTDLASRSWPVLAMAAITIVILRLQRPRCILGMGT